MYADLLIFGRLTYSKKHDQRFRTKNMSCLVFLGQILSELNMSGPLESLATSAARVFRVNGQGRWVAWLCGS